MRKRRCGNSNLELSIIGAGCWAFGGGSYWGEQSQRDVDEVVHQSLELGINYFDTAEVYNDGRSEQSLGQAIKGLPRDQIIVGSKIAPSNVFPGVLEQHCEASLSRLGVDYIDIYMLHWPIHPHSVRHYTSDESIINNPPSIESALDSMLKLREQGKLRCLGVSNFAQPRLEEIRDLSPDLVVNELPYSLLARAVEFETLDYCQAHAIGVISYMTLLQGLLADIYRTLDDVPDWQCRTRHFNCKRTERCRHHEPGAEAETNQALAEIRQIAAEAGMSMPEISIKWVLANEQITCALVGARNLAELQATVAAAGAPLPKELLSMLNQATDNLMAKLGPTLDLYESVENDRTR